MLTGRGTVSRGTLKVTGLLMSDRASTLRQRAAWVTPETLREGLADDPEVIVIDGAGPSLGLEGQAAIRTELRAWLQYRDEADLATPLIVVLAERSLAEMLLPEHLVVTHGTQDTPEEVLA